MKEVISMGKWSEEFELKVPKQVDEQQLTDALAERILEMLESQPEYVFSILYRMDVSEQKVADAMRADAPLPTNVGLARLVIERQRERMRTKMKYRKQGESTDFTW